MSWMTGRVRGHRSPHIIHVALTMQPEAAATLVQFTRQFTVKLLAFAETRYSVYRLSCPI